MTNPLPPRYNASHQIQQTEVSTDGRVLSLLHAQDKGQLELLSVEELAAQFKVTPKIIHNLVQTKGLPCLNFGPNELRFDPIAVRRWIDAGVGAIVSITPEAESPRPWCDNCQKPFKKDYKRADGTYVYRCGKCNNGRTPHPLGPTLPQCSNYSGSLSINTRRVDGNCSYCCRRCGRTEGGRRVNIWEDLARPWCIKCRRPMRRHGYTPDGRRKFMCSGCVLEILPDKIRESSRRCSPERRKKFYTLIEQGYSVNKAAQEVGMT